jgi:hypothetical protein
MTKMILHHGHPIHYIYIQAGTMQTSTSAPLYDALKGLRLQLEWSIAIMTLTE